MLTRYAQLRYAPRPWPSQRYCHGTEEAFKIVVESPAPSTTTETGKDETHGGSGHGRAHSVGGGKPERVGEFESLILRHGGVG